jgi:hypothetical protein
MVQMSQYHVKVAAEAFAAGFFAQAGCDVSIQYGADQPAYDLIIARGKSIRKVSVKGSQTGSWGLIQSYLQNADYHAAAEAWSAHQDRNIIVCLVQFKNVAIGEPPRAYLATPQEIADHLKRECRGRGNTILYEKRCWSARARGAGTTDQIPAEWRFSIDRLEQRMR